MSSVIADEYRLLQHLRHQQEQEQRQQQQRRRQQQQQQLGVLVGGGSDLCPSHEEASSSSGIMSSSWPAGQSSSLEVHADILKDAARGGMNKLVMDYLITEGFKEAAEKFETEANLSAPDELSQMEHRIRVRQCLQEGNVLQAIAQVHDKYPELLDDDKYLFFHLQQQQLIELIREGRLDDALSFASGQLAERGEEDPVVLDELERTMALFAFEDPAASPFGDLMADSHRQKVASELNAAMLRAEHAECSEPRLAGLLKMLLWSQSELDKKGVNYNKMQDLATGSTKGTK